MALHKCENRKCLKPFEPVFGQEETQKYCSQECGNRERVRRHHERHKQKPGGGGPGGKRQPMLFSRSEMHRRKPAKSALRPKPGELFPEDGIGVFAGAVISYADDGSISDVLVIGPNEGGAPASSRKPPQTAVAPEYPLAA